MVIVAMVFIFICLVLMNCTFRRGLGVNRERGVLKVGGQDKDKSCSTPNPSHLIEIHSSFSVTVKYPVLAFCESMTNDSSFNQKRFFTVQKSMTTNVIKKQPISLFFQQPCWVVSCAALIYYFVQQECVGRSNFRYMNGGLWMMNAHNPSTRYHQSTSRENSIQILFPVPFVCQYCKCSMMAQHVICSLKLHILRAHSPIQIQQSAIDSFFSIIFVIK